MRLNNHAYQKKTLIILILLSLILIFPSLASAAPLQEQAFNDAYLKIEASEKQNSEYQNTSEDKIFIYFFWGEGCPHCAVAKPALEDLVAMNPSFELKSFEIYNNAENQAIFFELASAVGFTPRAVPTIVIANQYWEGFSEGVKAEVISKMQTCLNQSCIDLGRPILLKYGLLTPTSEPTQVEEVATPTPVQQPTPLPTLSAPQNDPEKTINIPLIGEIDLSKQSMIVSTALIAFVDGFNPCSIWVLTMLLTLTLRTGSRKKIIIIGLVFLFVTSFIYALFIAGLFTVFSVISFVGWIRVLVALVSLFFGLVNLKDYFWYKEGISFTIDDKNKPGLYKRIRRVMDAGSSFWGLIGGTVILAAGVSMVEFSCTAGFPVLWTNLLTSQQVNTPTFIGLLLLYMVVYNLIALGIFIVAVFTLKSGKMEEKHGRILKLIGGVLMVTLAAVMVINPNLMSDLRDSLIVFGIAVLVGCVLLLLHRVILPKFGIYIGSETKPSKSSDRKYQKARKK